MIQITLATSNNLKALETLMSSELDKVKEWWDVNKSSINIRKTSYTRAQLKIRNIVMIDILSPHVLCLSPIVTLINFS